jgi:hypothetical protein
MTEPEAITGLRKIRTYLLESISQSADEVAAIDSEIEELLGGRAQYERE